MALDGSCMEVADEAANAEYFGYPGASRGQSAFRRRACSAWWNAARMW